MCKYSLKLAVDFSFSGSCACAYRMMFLPIVICTTAEWSWTIFGCTFSKDWNASGKTETRVELSASGSKVYFYPGATKVTHCQISTIDLKGNPVITQIPLIVADYQPH